MGDSLKLTKDKHHRSSSSLGGVVLDGTLSERKIVIKAAIPEGDDQFAIADARCENLQEKIDLVKSTKRKKKIRKRSMTKVSDPQSTEIAPFVTISTKPKKRENQQLTGLQYRKALVKPESQYQDLSKNIHGMMEKKLKQTKSPARVGRAAGDGPVQQEVQTFNTNDQSIEGTCGDYDDDKELMTKINKTESKEDNSAGRRRQRFWKWKSQAVDIGEVNLENIQKCSSRKPSFSIKGPRRLISQNEDGRKQNLDRPVVELFNKTHSESSGDSWRENFPAPRREFVDGGKLLSLKSSQSDCPRLDNLIAKNSARVFSKIKSRRHYETPTVASKIKQRSTRFYVATTNKTNMPFVVSKSTSPSYNIAANIQQILHSLKVRQARLPIPATMAFNMGLRHTTKEAQSEHKALNKEINTIKVGRRLLRLPLFKSLTYNQLLGMYREGDGMVSKFLRAIYRPDHQYTSMYNLITNREDNDGATSRGGAQETDRIAAEYAALFLKYQKISKKLQTQYDQGLARQHEELRKELAHREQYLRKEVYGNENASGIEARPSTSKPTTSRPSTSKFTP